DRQVCVCVCAYLWYWTGRQVCVCVCVCLPMVLDRQTGVCLCVPLYGCAQRDRCVCVCLCVCVCVCASSSLCYDDCSTTRLYGALLVLWTLCSGHDPDRDRKTSHKKFMCLYSRNTGNSNEYKSDHKLSHSSQVKLSFI